MAILFATAPFNGLSEAIYSSRSRVFDLSFMDNPYPASAVTQRSTRLAFLIAGFSGAAWAPIIPYVKLRCGLTDAHLGLLLLCLGVGSIVAMPVAGSLAGRFGCRWIIAVATLAVCCSLPVLSSSDVMPLLAVALTIFGAGVGSIDCVVNVQAVIVERACQKTMMSGFHGLFSVGGLLGAIGVSSLLSLGFSPLQASFVVVLLLLSACLALPGLLTGRTQSETGPVFPFPQGIVLTIGAMCFIVFLAEGAAIDWSAVFLTTVRHVEVRYTGLGYVAFASTMTIGRLLGDRLVRHISGRVLVTGGSLLAALGMLLVTMIPVWQMTLLGYALVGAGCANVVPVLYSAVGRQTFMPEHLAVSAITTLGYSGILAGPAALGFVAQSTNLPFALGSVGMLLVFVTVMGLVLPQVLINGEPPK
ncbi:major facilitator superfamily transporter [Gluconobacter frateurii NBRC 101659]|nr:major facilitator superfamily transporter [Gluconobacter frateurii NBRC 101659]